MVKRPKTIKSIIPALPRYVGSVMNGLVSASTGDPFTGALLGEFIGQAGEDFANRALSTREEARVATVLELAASQVGKRLAEGESVRDDGLFDQGGDDAEEILEGILLAAQDEYQKKKLPHMASLFANIVFAPSVSVETAHLAIREAESLTWLEACLLSMISRPEEFPLPDAEIAHRNSPWADWTVIQTLQAMIGDGRPLHHPYLEGERSIPIFDLRLSSIQLSGRGTLLVGLMDLEDIDEAEIEGAFAALARSVESPNN